MFALKVSWPSQAFSRRHNIRSIFTFGCFMVDIRYGHFEPMSVCASRLGTVPLSKSYSVWGFPVTVLISSLAVFDASAGLCCPRAFGCDRGRAGPQKSYPCSEEHEAPMAKRKTGVMPVLLIIDSPCCYQYSEKDDGFQKESGKSDTVNLC